MTTTAPEQCPRCGRRTMDPTPVWNALSRKDNKTYVCSSCGSDEAMINIEHGRDADVWPGHPGIALHYRTDEEYAGHPNSPGVEHYGDYGQHPGDA